MRRSLSPEIMDNPDVSESMMQTFHRDLKVVNTLMGNMRLLVERLRRHPPSSALDIGCGNGALLHEIRRHFEIAVTGVDLRVPAHDPYGVPIIAADATGDALPQADTAVSLFVIHHLSEDQVVALIRNVGRSCHRFIFLDLVRHPLPMVLFTAFICPFIHKPAALDGRQSIRRAFTGAELRSLTERALDGTGATFEHWVSPIYARQIIDINYRNKNHRNKNHRDITCRHA